MINYTLYIDYKATSSKTYAYMEMEAKTLEDAIEEADNKWNDDIYLMRIMKRQGLIERSKGITVEVYEATLCRRSYGWHLNNKKNSEGRHLIRKYTQRFNKAKCIWYN